MSHWMKNILSRWAPGILMGLMIQFSALGLSIDPGVWVGRDINPADIITNTTGFEIQIEIVSLKLTSLTPITVTPAASTTFDGRFDIEIEIIPLALSGVVIPYNTSFNATIGTPGINPLPTPPLPDTDRFIIPLDPFGPIPIDPSPAPFVLPEPDFRFLPNGGGALGGEVTFKNDFITDSFFDIEYRIEFQGIGAALGSPPPITSDELVFDGRGHLTRIIPTPSALGAGLLGLMLVSLRRRAS